MSDTKKQQQQQVVEEQLSYIDSIDARLGELRGSLNYILRKSTEAFGSCDEDCAERRCSHNKIDNIILEISELQVIANDIVRNMDSLI